MDLLSLQSNPVAFRAALLIDTDSGPAPFAEVQGDWQRTDFEALDSGWLRAVLGTKHEATYSRGWLERPRGHSKTLDIAVQSLWALFASRRRLSGIAAAADLDQARLLRDAMGRLVYVNPWLQSIIEIQNYRCLNARTESTLEIISSDAPTSYGLTPDFIIADEVTHWKKRELWDSLISSAAKRSTCMVVVITNAGLSDDWQWQTREAIRTDPSWYFSRLEGPVASWITADRLAEQERLLPHAAFERLWRNTWCDAATEWVAPEILEAAFNPQLRPQDGKQPGYTYLAGLDLGVSRNSSAVCVLGVVRGHDGHGRIKLARTKIWKPRKGQKVDLQQVEDTLFDLHVQFGFKQLNYDPWQATFMASRLQAGGLGKLVSGSNRKPALPMVEIAQTSQNLQKIATNLIESFNDRRVELFPDPDLHRELKRMRIEERASGGFRLVSPHEADGSHGDLASAFALAMLAASELAAKKQIVAGVFGAGSTASNGQQLDPLERAFERIRLENERRERERKFAPEEEARMQPAWWRQMLYESGRL